MWSFGINKTTVLSDINIYSAVLKIYTDMDMETDTDSDTTETDRGTGTGKGTGTVRDRQGEKHGKGHPTDTDMDTEMELTNLSPSIHTVQYCSPSTAIWTFCTYDL
jgi:hypothetical protein